MPSHDPLQRAQELLGCRFLGEIAGGAQLEHPQGELVLGEHGQDQYGQVRLPRVQLAEDFEAVPVG